MAIHNRYNVNAVVDYFIDNNVRKRRKFYISYSSITNGRNKGIMLRVTGKFLIRF